MPVLNTISLSQKLKIDRISDNFEASWERYLRQNDASVSTPQIEDFLTDAEVGEREHLFRELLAIELACVGSELALSSSSRYFQRFPEQADTIRELLERYTPNEIEQRVPQFEAGHRIGRYDIVNVIGAGGFGSVYRAFDSTLQRHVAIKVPHVDVALDPDAIKAYISEARVLASLRHSNIVLIYDVVHESQHLFYFVSQLIEGRNLAEQIAKARLTPAESINVVASMAEALDYAHRRGVVHRDVKPANILLDSLDHPYLTDFGLALRDEDYGVRGRQGGTIAYMSPEQARGEGHLVDGRSDIFSLGVILYELLTGVRPFRGDRQQILEQLVTADARPLRMIDGSIPRELERICQRAMAKRVSERYSTASDLAEELRQCLTSVNKPDAPVLTNVPASSHETKRPVVPKGLRPYDAEDSPFFLRLLPGPRVRDDLPDSLHFWKSRIESTDVENSFRVALLYGPSGCGKTSFLRAGLLPHLAKHVKATVVECAATETESRLIRGIHRLWPQLVGEDLVDAIATLRRSLGRVKGTKTLIVLDQFEQWLHTRRENVRGELVRALRQCDGINVQCILSVRDDFWLAVSRFLDELDIDLREGQNTASLDLFDQQHARQVLLGFGQAYGKLPAIESEITAQQHLFLDRAIATLSRDGKIAPVRLAVFADIVKTKPWTPNTLRTPHGSAGIGVMFLDDTFLTSANPRRRMHARAAQNVLAALLPDAASDLKSHAQSLEQLRTVSGYGSEPREFAELLRILDQETRLISPTDPFESSQSAAGGADDQTRYQLTHDYLVPALRHWLNREQSKTRRGRAEIRLARLTAEWKAKPDARRLPRWWETINIATLTRWSDWSPTQRSMMKQSLLRFSLYLIAMLATLLAGTYFTAKYQRQRLLDTDIANIAQRSQDIVVLRPIVQVLLRSVDSPTFNSSQVDSAHCAQLLWNELPQDWRRVPQIDKVPLDVLHQLRSLVAKQDVLPWNEITELLELREPETQSLCLFAASLVTYRTSPYQADWNGLPSDQRNQINRNIVRCLMALNDEEEAAKWAELLVDLKSALTPVLYPYFTTTPFTALTDTPAMNTTRNSPNEAERLLASSILAVWNQTDMEGLVSLLRDVDPDVDYRQIDRIYREVSDGTRSDFVDAVQKATLKLVAQQESLGASDRPTQRNLWSLAVGNLACIGLRNLDDRDTSGAELFEATWSECRKLLAQNDVAGIHAAVIHQAPRFFRQQTADKLLRILDHELILPDDKRSTSIVRTILLALQDRRNEKAIVNRVERLYLGDAAGTAESSLSKVPEIHSVCEWLLNRWEIELPESQGAKTLTPSNVIPDDDLSMYVTQTNQHKMIRIRPSEGLFRPAIIGLHEVYGPRQMSLDYHFFVASTETTRQHFREFISDSDQLYEKIVPGDKLSVFAPNDDCPILGICLAEAMAYCNWLSAKEGLAYEEWAYIFELEGQPITDADFDSRLRQYRSQQPKKDTDREEDIVNKFWAAFTIQLPANGKERHGYRLPTFTEWQIACAESPIDYFAFGSDPRFLNEYAWTSNNSVPGGDADSDLLEERSGSVGTKIPNRKGIFDIHGNAWEWCHNNYLEVVAELGITLTADAADDAKGKGLSFGGSFRSGDTRVGRPQVEDDKVGPGDRDSKNGFRIVRPIPRKRESHADVSSAGAVPK